MDRPPRRRRIGRYVRWPATFLAAVLGATLLLATPARAEVAGGLPGRATKVHALHPRGQGEVRARTAAPADRQTTRR